MNYYTSIVPVELVERLYEAGCPNIGRYEEADGSVRYSEVTYADIFDGLIEKGLSVEISRSQAMDGWCVVITEIETKVWRVITPWKVWYDAAKHAILSASGLLKDKKKYE